MNSKTTKWVIDPSHSEVSFKVKHMMISTVRGHFEEFDASASTNGEDFTDADISVEIKSSSINTKNADRDNHLKSDDFFNAEKFPTIQFESTSFTGEDLKGKLTIRDITKEVNLKAELHGIAVDPYGQTKAGFSITGSIDRKEFGLKWSAITEAGSIVVSDKVDLVIDVQMIKQ